MQICLEANGKLIYPRNDFDMKIRVLGRREPGTEYYYEQFRQIVSQLPDTFECYYIWLWEDTITMLSKINFTQPNVFLFFTDTWTTSEIANINDNSSLAEKLIDIVLDNPKINFYICSESVNAHLEFEGIKNIKVLNNTVAPLMTHKQDLENLTPILNKNFNSEKTSVILTRRPKYIRTNTLSYLLGKSLDKHIRISYNTSSFANFESWYDYCPWVLNNITEEQQNNLINGFKLLQSYDKSDWNDINELEKIKKINSETEDADNFKLNLSKIFQNSFVEIISETTFAEKTFCLGEKTTNTIFGCNFPIMLSGVGAVDHLRQVSGFDMFDDVINHDYDSIIDPIERMVQAVELNYEILTNSGLVKELWLKNQDRFLNNIDIYKNHMTKKYEENLMQELAKIK